MRKCIKLNEEMILKEVLHQIDRNNDFLTYQFVIEPIYNTSYRKIEEKTFYELVVCKSDKPEVWLLLKDEQQDIMEWLVTEIIEAVEYEKIEELKDATKFFYIEPFVKLLERYPNYAIVELTGLEP